MRLGTPLAVWTLGVWPALLLARDLAGGSHNISFWDEVLHRQPFFEPGPMWFIEVLLIYSLGYAAWRQWGSHHESPFVALNRRRADRRQPLQGPTLVVLAAGISLATILIRPAFPFDSKQIGQLKLWQWPQYLGMFGLGIVAVQRGWLDPVPARIRRRCGQAVLLSIVGLAQQHLNRPPSARGRALARSAFAAFVLQGPVIIALQIALRPVGAPGEVKAVIVACGAVAVSFALTGRRDAVRRWPGCSSAAP